MSMAVVRVDGHPSVDELAAALAVLTWRHPCLAADAEASGAIGGTGFAAGWRAGRRAVLRVAGPDDGASVGSEVTRPAPI
jgi:hypothetical protein